jgi:hypothetical protein
MYKENVYVPWSIILLKRRMKSCHLSEIEQTPKEKYLIFSLTEEFRSISTDRQKQLNLKGGLFGGRELAS